MSIPMQVIASNYDHMKNHVITNEMQVCDGYIKQNQLRMRDGFGYFTEHKHPFDKKNLINQDIRYYHESVQIRARL